MRALFVDDHEAVHHLLNGVVSSTFPEITERVSARSVESMFDTLDQATVDLVVLDLVMPGALKRISLLQAVLAHPSQPKVLVYSGQTHPVVVTVAMRAGAAGFVHKGAPLSHFQDAIRAILAGDTYLDPAINIEQPHPWFLLSPAEREVLVQLAGGCTPKEVAAHTDRAYTTIASLRQGGMRKLGLSSTEELLCYFYDNGLEFELDPGYDSQALRKEGDQGRPGPEDEGEPVVYVAPPAKPRLGVAAIATGKVIELYSQHLTAEERVDCETIALVMMKLEPDEVRRLIRVGGESLDELEQLYAPTEQMVNSSAWRWPVRRWRTPEVQVLAIDLGNRRVWMEMIAAKRQKGLTQSVDSVTPPPQGRPFSRANRKIYD